MFEKDEMMTEKDKVVEVKERFMGEKDTNSGDANTARADRETRLKTERRRKISLSLSALGILLIIGWVFINTYFLESPQAYFYRSDEIGITLSLDYSPHDDLDDNEFIRFRELLENENRFINTDDERMADFPRIVSLMRRTDDFYTRGEPLVVKGGSYSRGELHEQIFNGNLTMAQSFRTRVMGGVMLVEVMHLQYSVNHYDETLTLSRPTWFAFEYDSRRNRIEFIQQPRDRARLTIYNIGVEFTADDSIIEVAAYIGEIIRQPGEGDEWRLRALQQGVTIFNSIPTNIVAQAPFYFSGAAPSFVGIGEHSHNWTVAGFEINYTDLMYNFLEEITFWVIPQDDDAQISARIFVNRPR